MTMAYPDAFIITLPEPDVKALTLTVLRIPSVFHHDPQLGFAGLLLYLNANVCVLDSPLWVPRSEVGEVRFILLQVCTSFDVEQMKLEVLGLQ